MYLNSPAQDYIRGKAIGEGMYAKVHIAHTSSGPMAQKTMPCTSEDDIAHVIREIAAISIMKHPHIIHVSDVHLNDSEIYLTMEVAQCDLHQAIMYNTLKTEEKKWAVAGQIVEGVNYYMSRGLLHRDLKPENILMFHGKIKIADFGCSRFAPSYHSFQMTHPMYTLCFRAPEVLREELYDWRAEIWALGCVLYELSSGHIAFPGNKEDEIQQLWAEAFCDKSLCPTRDVAVTIEEKCEREEPPGHIKFMDKVISYRFKDTIKSCLKVNPIERMHPSQLLTYFGKLSPHLADNMKINEYRSNYKRTAVQMKNVAYVYDWLYSISDNLELTPSVVFLAFSLFERYDLMHHSYNVEDYQLISLACLTIAAALIDSINICFDFIDISDVRQCAFEVMFALKFDLFRNTVADFVLLNTLKENMHDTMICLRLVYISMHNGPYNASELAGEFMKWKESDQYPADRFVYHKILEEDIILWGREYDQKIIWDDKK